MNKVVTIHLDGIAYSLEEEAYDALLAYLDTAKAALAQNPDRDEIIKDLEQAIGVKLSAFLNEHKNVVTHADVDAVLTEMGPVAAESDDTSAEGADKVTAAAPVQKRLYRIPEGEWVAGVCTGLAVYFNVDVSVVRVLFVIVIALSHGFGGLAYIIMWIVVPVARTPKDYENAAGVPPITAQELVDRARKSIEDLATSGDWQNWRAQLKETKYAAKAQRRAWKHQGREWQDMQKQQWKHYQYHQPQSFLSELNGFIWSMFGLLVMLFVLWYLYHHVQLVQQYGDFLHSLWNALVHTLVQAFGNK